MKKVIITLCCLVSIFTIQGMQQTSSSGAKEKLLCNTSIGYVKKLLDGVPSERKEPQQGLTLAECTGAYYPQAGYLQELLTYLKAHANEPVEDSRVSMAVIEPLTFHLHLSYIASLIAYEQQAAQPQGLSCTCAAETVRKLLSDPEYRGKKPAEIAYSKIITLLVRQHALTDDANTLANARPPVSQDLQRYLCNEHTAIINALTAAQRFFPASDIALPVTARAARSVFCLPCKISVLGAFALLIMRLMQHSTLPSDVVLEQPVMHLPAQAAPAPHEILMPHIRQALADVVSADTKEEYSSNNLQD